MKKIILISFVCSIWLFNSCNQLASKNSKIVSERSQPIGETQYLLKLARLKDDAQMAQNPFIKDSVVNSFNKYAKDSIWKVKDWIMVVEGIKESYLLGRKVYVLTLTADVNDSKSDDSRLHGTKEKFEDVFPEKSNVKSINDLLKSIHNLIPGDTVKVSGMPKYTNSNGDIDYKGVTEPLIFDALIFDISGIRKK